MPNEVIRQLKERKSVRVFTDEPIHEDIIQEILLAESCDHQPFIAQGKLVLVFCADCLKWFDAYRYAGCDPRTPGPGDFLIAADDALIAAQNAVTAAQSFGIGSCYIGDIMENYEIQRRILALPEYVVPAALVVFGYPTEQQKQRTEPKRADLRYIVHENTYHRLNEEELRSALGKQEHARSYDAWIRAFFARKYDSAFAREMNRSAAASLKQFQTEESEAETARQ